MRWLPVLSSPTSPTESPPPLSDRDERPEGSVRPAPSPAPLERRVYLEVFGCQMNKLDAELMLAVLDDAGYVLTDDVTRAGVVLYNTCAIREQAENRVFSQVGALRALKGRRPDLVIGVLGCSAQNHREAVFRRFPHVGIVCGPGEFLRLPELIDEARRNGRVAALDLERPVRFERRRNLGPNPYQAFVSVMRGCDMACTYCVVPRTRGPEVSRPVREIVDEVRALVDGGVREVTLLGQTVNSYGKRLAPGRRVGLHHVFRELDRIRGLERLRFITSHPRFMSPELIDAMASLDTVCEYLHLPVQSGADSVLWRMRRSYRLDHYRRVVALSREKIPGIGMATDFIVGFPGETDEEFEETRRLMEEVRFQSAFIFRYSERPGTPAAEMADDVPDPVKRERQQILLGLQKKISLEENRAALGGVVEVLVERRSKLDASRWSGRDRRQRIVVFPGPEGEDLVGRLLPVRLTDATPLTLVGERAGPSR
ncbi:MAG: tRNA (N6-isopentenyl adenosine(37)-C2)-methylthiotransferase MiaB [Planctomycetota bacterium]|nr:tRNA (N6-isopentenyl adenosine(37)-C2)-methylthiotransferase MiaB [Planctomycetota bacterium]